MMISNRNFNLRALAFVMLIGLFLAACSPKDQLLGVWSQQGGDFHIRFHTGDFVSQKAYFGDAVLTLTGTYEILNDSQIMIEFEEGEWRGVKSGLYDFTISGDELQLGDMTFERQPDVFRSE